MAVINTAELRKCIFATLISRNDVANDKFDLAVENRPYDGYDNNGVRICHGRSEGLTAIELSFSSLPGKRNKVLFANLISAAIADALIDTTPDQLLYAHFLFHGLKQPSVQAIADKIRDNGRIINSSLRNRHKISLPEPMPRITDFDFISLTNGMGEDIEGLSFQLNHIEPGLPKHDDQIAKCGLTFDFENKTAYIINLQGREVRRKFSTQDSKALEKHKRYTYWALQNHLGTDPRTFILEQAVKILADQGFTTFKAITPDNNVLHIANHPGFKGKYLPNLQQAGFIESTDNGLYVVKRVS